MDYAHEITVFIGGIAWLIPLLAHALKHATKRPKTSDNGEKHEN